MLQDLEQRRTAEAGMSPLGGLSSSGSGMRAANPVNYFLLGMVLVLVVMVAAGIAYLFEVKPSSLVSGHVPQAQPQQIIVESERKPVLAPDFEAGLSVVKGIGIENNEVGGDKDSLNKVELNKVKFNKVDAGKDGAPKKIVQEKIASKKAKLASAKNIIDEENVNLIKPEQVKPIVGNVITTKSRPLAAEQLMKPVSAANIEKHIRPLTAMQQSQVLFQSAVKHIGRGKDQDAHNELRKALSLVPTYSRARETLAALMLNTGRVSEAAELLREGLSLQPKDAPLAKLYARILMGQNDLDSAIAILERAQPSALKDPHYLALLAALYQRTGKHAMAVQSYQQVLRVRPGVASWWMGLALSLEPTGEINGAINAFNQALKVGGLNKEVLQFVVGRIEVIKPVNHKHEAEAMEE